MLPRPRAVGGEDDPVPEGFERTLEDFRGNGFVFGDQNFHADNLGLR